MPVMYVTLNRCDHSRTDSALAPNWGALSKIASIASLIKGRMAFRALTLQHRLPRSEHQNFNLYFLFKYRVPYRDRAARRCEFVAESF